MSQSSSSEVHQRSNITDSAVTGQVGQAGGNLTQNQGEVIVEGDRNVITFHTQIVQIIETQIKARSLHQNSPYKGLKKFESEDRSRFFGRDQFLTGLVNDLEQSQLILLLGASGSGKSSVVRAGLIPWLVQKWGNRFVNLTFPPDEDPFESLYGSLLRRYNQAEAKAARQISAETLSHVVKDLKKSEEYWLIFIDQFEELFTRSHGEKRDRFLDGLVQLIKIGEPHVKLLLTMRADFLDRFSTYPTLGKLTQKQIRLMTDMQREELRQAIEQPAAQHGVLFEDNLVEEIINDVQGQAGYLPLLQYTLNLLWKTEAQAGNFADRTLHISTYQQLGGVRGALQQHVDRIYDALPRAEQLAAQRIILKLVDIGGNEESGAEWKPVRRRANRTEFNDVSEQDVLIQLINQNLLVSNRQTQSQIATIEIAHEALLTSWSRLSQWIQEHRRAIALRNRLNDDVTRWQTTRKEDELWSGSKLEQVVELRKDATFNQVLGGFSTAANQFIDISVGRRDRQRRRTILGLASFSAIALILASAAAWQGHRAEAQRRQAVVGQINSLAARSDTLFNSNQSIDALVEAIKAASKVQTTSKIPDETQQKVLTVLQQAVYGLRELNLLEGHSDHVYQAEFSTDGQRIITSSWDGTVRFWTKDGIPLSRIKGQQQYLYHISFDPTNQLISTNSVADNNVKLWDQNGKLIKTIQKPKNITIHTAHFSPDGKSIASVSDNNTIILWQPDGSIITTLRGHYDLVNSVSFSPDGQTLATASNDRTIKLWKRDGTLIQTLTGHQGDVMKVRFSPNGKTLASVSRDKTIRLWQEGSLLRTLKGHTDAVYGVQFSPDGEILASASQDKTIKLWLSDGTELSTLEGHSDAVTSVRFSPDGKQLLSASADTTVKVWQLDNPSLKTLSNRESNFTRFRFSRNEQQILTGDDTGQLKFWTFDGKELKSKVLNPHEGKSFEFSFSRDGKILVTTDEEQTVKIWKTDGTISRTLKVSDQPLETLFSTLDGIVGCTYLTRYCEFWKFDGQSFHQISKTPLGWTWGAWFSDDLKTVATVDRGIVKLWQADGTLQSVFKAHSGEVLAIDFSQDGQLFATSSFDRTIKIWTLEGKLTTTLKGHTAMVHSFRFSPDGQMVVSTGGDNTVRIWRKDGTLLATLNTTFLPDEAKISPDNRIVAFFSGDNSIMLWNIADLYSPPSLIAKGCLLLEDYLVTHPQVLAELKVCEKGDSSLRAKAQRALKQQQALKLLEEGQDLAFDEKSLEVATQKFRQALQLNPALGLNPEAEAQKLLMQGQAGLWRDDAAMLALDEPKEAHSKLQQALELNPDLVITPEQEISSVQMLQLIDKAQQILKKPTVIESQVQTAIDFYLQADKLHFNQEITVYQWERLCWLGTLQGYATKVMFACEKAVNLNPLDGDNRDGRGAARAIAGNYSGAIEDFQVYLDWTDDSDPLRAKRLRWIEVLRQGKNPFTPEELRELRQQETDT